MQLKKKESKIPNFDFASLYPNTMMVILNDKEMRRLKLLKERGEKLKKLNLK